MDPITHHLNFDNVSGFPPVSKEKEDKLVETVKSVFEVAKFTVTEGLHAHVPQSINIDATINGHVHHILSSDSNSYSANLVTQIAGKILYLANDKFTLNAESFEFIRRIPEDSWKHIVTLLNAADAITEQELKDFKEGNWNASVFQKEDWPILAFQAYFDGKIDQERMTALILYDGCKSAYGDTLKSYQLVDTEGNVNTEAFEIFKQSTVGWLSDEERTQALETFKKMPAENSQFFCAPHKQEMKFTKTIYRDSHGLNVRFGFIPEKDLAAPQFTVFFQPEFTFKLYEMKGGKEYASRPKKVCGYSSKEDFQKLKMRDVYIPCRYVTSPSIHGFDSPHGVEVYLHDLYVHLLIEAYITNPEFWLKFAAVLEREGFFDIQNHVLDKVWAEYLYSRRAGTFNEDVSVVGAAHCVLTKLKQYDEIRFVLQFFSEKGLLEPVLKPFLKEYLMLTVRNKIDDAAKREFDKAEQLHVQGDAFVKEYINAISHVLVASASS